MGGQGSLMHMGSEDWPKYSSTTDAQMLQTLMSVLMQRCPNTLHTTECCVQSSKTQFLDGQNVLYDWCLTNIYIGLVNRQKSSFMVPSVKVIFNNMLLQCKRTCHVAIFTDHFDYGQSCSGTTQRLCASVGSVVRHLFSMHGWKRFPLRLCPHRIK